MCSERIGIIVIMVIMATTVTSHANDGHLFILTGASGMEHVKPEKSFAPVVARAFGKQNVTVVKVAKGGRNIGYWDKSYVIPEGATMPAKEEIGSLYDALMKDVKAATAGKTYDTVTLVWAHGARDGRANLASGYVESFKRIVTQFKTDLSITSMNVVIGRLNDWKGGMTAERYKDWVVIRELQVKLAEELPNSDWVDSDDLNDGGKNNALHNTEEGYNTSGKRFAEKAIDLIRKTGKTEEQ